ncbi:hypothetical protein RIF29_08072 [Crotalaria pallida]|uniref:Uncharacterized protein n=1 Tax=Crotalaria pallida TaxID=3830 RepID=A0AAN9PCG5_CROPI
MLVWIVNVDSCSCWDICNQFRTSVWLSCTFIVFDCCNPEKKKKKKELGKGLLWYGVVVPIILSGAYLVKLATTGREELIGRIRPWEKVGMTRSITQTCENGFKVKADC